MALEKLSVSENNTYDQLWFKRGAPRNIHIVNFELGCENSPYLKTIIFGNPGSRYYDGCHFRGDGASRHLTYRAILAIKPVIVSSTARITDYDRSDYNNQGQSQPDYRHGNTSKFTVPRKSRKYKDVKKTEINPNRYGSNVYSVPVQNRFTENF